MEKREKIKIGEPGYLNQNCWLVRSLNYAPYKRCQYCELKFRNCLFLQYQIISLILIIFLLILSFLVKGKNSELLIISVFILVIVYGYFFNKSTDKLIQANFNERKAKELLEDFNKTLQQKVDEQTKEIRKAYEVEKKARKELDRLDKAKDQFILATQHHMRTPLTSMRGYASMLLEGHYGELQPQAKEAIDKFLNSTTRLVRIVNELLDISQFQLGKKVVNLQPGIKLKPIFKEIIEELKPETEDKGIYLKLEIPQKLPSIKADPNKLKVALFNLVDNGIKYTKQGGVTIKFQIHPAVSGTNLKIIIQDTGLGLAKEKLPTLFTRTFERGEEAKKVHGTGRGIGLYIAAKIIEAHQGRVWAESEGKDKGSTFYVELPVG